MLRGAWTSMVNGETWQEQCAAKERNIRTEDDRDYRDTRPATQS
jgi:hypothetical protein